MMTTSPLGRRSAESATRWAASVSLARSSERQLMEQLNYNLLCRWFVGLSPDDAVWDATTFTKNRERLQG